MKKYFPRPFFLVLVFVFTSNISIYSSKAGDTFSFKQIDKQLHMTASYGLSLTVTRWLETKQLPRWQAVLYSSLFTMAVGTSKELVVDSAFSGADILANAIGTATSAAIVFTFEL